MYSIGNMARKKQEEFDELVIGNKNLPKNKIVKQLQKGDVEVFFVSEVNSWANGGGYIPSSEEYVGKKVYVLVLARKNK